MLYLSLSCSNPPPPVSLLSHSKVPVQELYKGVGGAGSGGGGLSWGWSSWIPHHSNWQTFTKHWGISSYQLDYWSLRERLLYETNTGYHQEPGRGWSPTAIFIFSPLIFFFFFDRVGKLFFFYLLTPPCSSILLLSLPLSFSVLFWKRDPLCHSIFSSPLLFCAHCHPVESWVVAVGLVLRKHFSPTGNLNSCTVTFPPGSNLSAGPSVSV